MNVDILRIGPGDAAVLDRVAEDVFDDDIDPVKLAAYLAAPGHMMIVAVSNGVVVGQTRGMIQYHPDKPTELYIDNLGVTPARQRERIASRLLDELTAWGLEHGCEGAWVATEIDNAPARALYGLRGAEGETFVGYFYEFDDT